MIRSGQHPPAGLTVYGCRGFFSSAADIRVLIACEFSGVVREAFNRLGCQAWSCDLLPTEIPGRHYQGDAIEVIRSGRWDVLIAHPPCTYLSNSGVRHLYIDGKKDYGINAYRWEKMRDAAAFFDYFISCPILYKRIENPVIHGHAASLISRRFSQSVQPWQFGHGEVKRTCLWNINLPDIVPTDIVSGRSPRVHHASPGPDRWKERSRTYPGLAEAIARQTVEHLLNV